MERAMLAAKLNSAYGIKEKTWVKKTLNILFSVPGSEPRHWLYILCLPRNWNNMVDKYYTIELHLKRAFLFWFGLGEGLLLFFFFFRWVLSKLQRLAHFVSQTCFEHVIFIPQSPRSCHYKSLSAFGWLIGWLVDWFLVLWPMWQLPFPIVKGKDAGEAVQV